eukprot:CAMPEP_0206404260 /NCGR_PEP_ID=MMETSP0294-20121207/28252_1 /ASSEMBLY_ACC=CAM_ASM_000327 /TAXON_ID=39354 /ORGANISM="Heterosigma akashiwo, Strain CCMP2393" /LENGTH=34 /DNA_ID= /DNA_START= /DNA_END= /DNA_ORIENTATION=
MAAPIVARTVKNEGPVGERRGDQLPEPPPRPPPF